MPFEPITSEVVQKRREVFRAHLSWVFVRAKERGLSVDMVAKASDTSRAYVYYVLSGERGDGEKRTSNVDEKILSRWLWVLLSYGVLDDEEANHIMNLAGQATPDQLTHALHVSTGDLQNVPIDQLPTQPVPYLSHLKLQDA